MSLLRAKRSLLYLQKSQTETGKKSLRQRRLRLIIHKMIITEGLQRQKMLITQKKIRLRVNKSSLTEGTAIRKDSRIDQDALIRSRL